MLSFLRAKTLPRTNRAKENPIIYEDGASSLEFRPSADPQTYLLRNMHPPFNQKDPSIMVPPFHFHMYQTEHFRIVSGKCYLFKDTSDTPWRILDESDPNAAKTAFIPPNQYHTINNASTTQPLLLDISLTPEDIDGEERFFRNFFGYLDDCKKEGQSPSIFQLFAFLQSADTPLALPIAPRWFGRFLSRALMNAMGYFGRWILGYKSTYDEYYVAKDKAL
ncbi:unnamed protein product [Clonostachys rhizophaga]|uniref:Uncharacterized protein n=1 Tax=Clonostachys rhizophaga TaxID=160324 RepID=A0A9N9VJW1_9HYPO|nr:unnamed protein product [Clonostachys rhizophaga]